MINREYMKLTFANFFKGIYENSVRLKYYYDRFIISFQRDGTVYVYDVVNNSLKNLSSNLVETNHLEFDQPRIKLLMMMKARRLSQYDLACKIQVSQPTISRYLNGDISMGAEIVEMLCDALHVDIDEFYDIFD